MQLFSTLSALLVAVAITTVDAGGFTKSCRSGKINVFSPTPGYWNARLEALCSKSNGQEFSTYLYLEDYIINANAGKLSWQLNGNFVFTCWACRWAAVKTKGVMACNCDNGTGGRRYSEINLDTRISNQNGKLTFDGW